MVTPETIPDDPDRAATSRLRSRRIAAWVLVVAWAAFIFFMSAHTGHDLDEGTGLVAQVRRWLAEVASSVTGQQVDVSPVGHFCEYMVFGALLMNALRLHMSLGRSVACTMGVVALYAISDEVHQIFVPGRACDPADWAVDMVGALLAALIFWAIAQRMHNKRDNHNHEPSAVEGDKTYDA